MHLLVSAHQKSIQIDFSREADFAINIKCCHYGGYQRCQCDFNSVPLKQFVFCKWYKTPRTQVALHVCNVCVWCTHVLYGLLRTFHTIYVRWSQCPFQGNANRTQAVQAYTLHPGVFAYHRLLAIVSPFTHTIYFRITVWLARITSLVDCLLIVSNDQIQPLHTQLEVTNEPYTGGMNMRNTHVFVILRCDCVWYVAKSASLDFLMDSTYHRYHPRFRGPGSRYNRRRRHHRRRHLLNNRISSNQYHSFTRIITWIIGTWFIWLITSWA